jgi:hypothetical protein
MALIYPAFWSIVQAVSYICDETRSTGKSSQLISITTNFPMVSATWGITAYLLATDGLQISDRHSFTSGISWVKYEYLLLYFKPTEVLTTVLSLITVIKRLQCPLEIQVNQAYRCKNGKVTQPRLSVRPFKWLGCRCSVSCIRRGMIYCSQPGLTEALYICKVFHHVLYM